MDNFMQKVPDIDPHIPNPCWILEGDNRKDIVGCCCTSVLIFSSKKLALARRKEMEIWNVRPKRYSREDLIIKFVFSEIIAGIIIDNLENAQPKKVLLRKIIAI
ncbi:hypothetical protein ACFLY1_00990 [Patescibacteria group bacterium]